MSNKNKVFIVLEIIDLGDQIVSLHFSETIANQEAQRLNNEWQIAYPLNRKENYYVAKHIIQT
jgi:hypothetical protein